MVQARLESVRSEALAVLNGIIDPCSRAIGLPAGLVDMGLVRDVEVISHSGRITLRVILRLTEPGCMMSVPFTQEALTRLEGVPEVDAVEVSMDRALDWRIEDMSVDYRRRLAAHRTERTTGSRRAASGRLPPFH
jgi:metal-sulfur cluster biosynthetic enzyme